MATNNDFEEEFKTMKRHFGGIVSLVKDLKARLESLEIKVQPGNDQEVKDIAEKQARLDELVVVNKESIIRIDKEMEEMKNSGFGSQSSRGNHTEEVKGASEKGIVTKKCRYYDKGYCKYASKCRYSHPKEMCRTYKESKRCKDRGCGGRHPRACKWFQRDVGCRRLNCDYLHVKIHFAMNENLQKEYKQFKCAGCSDIWEDKNCVIKHQLKL